MKTSGVTRSIYWVSVGLIVSVVLLSGTGILGPDRPVAGTGTAQNSVELSNITLEERPGTLRQTKVGTDGYILEPPRAKLTLEAVDGHPRIIYRITIHDLDYARSTLYVLSASEEGTTILVGDRNAAVPDTRLDRDSYDAEIAILRVNGSQSDVLFRKTVTIRVSERR